MSKEKIVFITVNYKKTEDTISFIESLASLEGFTACRIVIVDNESTNESKLLLEELKNKYPNKITCFYNNKNLFYLKGVAFALNNLYSDKNKMPEWIIVCNNDIIIEQRDFVLRLLSLNYKDYGIIAPSIISSLTGKDQNPFLVHHFRKLDILKQNIFLANWYLASLIIILRRPIKIIRSYLKPVSLSRETHRIYAPYGAFVIFSRVFFEKGGFLDTNFELYGEEITIAEIAQNIGVPVIYYPYLKVIHKCHASTGINFSKNNFYYAKRAHKHFCAKYLDKKKDRF